MACFTVPLAEAVIAASVQSLGGRKLHASRNPFLARLGWLRDMAFGGSFLLAIEHVWHGEITWRFPFLTAVENGETSEMLHEMATSGVAMALLVTTVWVCMVLVSMLRENLSAATEA
jgi:hypothetical protein